MEQISELFGAVEVGPLFNLVRAAVTAFLILLVGYWVAVRVGRAIQRRAEADPRLDRTLGGFLGRLARWAILAVTILAVLGEFGVETTSLVALVGAAGLTIGLALQGALTSFAAGLLIVVFRPFRVGDYVEAAGHGGTVRAVELFTTELVTVDNVAVILPNSDVWNGPIINYSTHPQRRLDLTYGVTYESDLRAAERAIRAAIEAERPEQGGAGRIVDQPAEPFVAVTALADSAVEMTMRVWCASSDYWSLRFDMLRAVKDRMDAEGVEIAYPTQTTHLRGAGSPGGTPAPTPAPTPVSQTSV